MGLFTPAQVAIINKAAEKSKQTLQPAKPSKSITSVNAELNRIAAEVTSYFRNSDAVCITTLDGLRTYVDHVISCGYAGIDTETTGLDRIHDHIVGASLYYPGGVECYIPMKHLMPVFDTPYKNQLTYDQVRTEFQRIVDSDVKLIFANADFDLCMIYKDLGVDFCDNFFYDVILAWRCIKEDEPDNKLKTLYNKYVMKGVGDPKKFSDFFPVSLFPYCKPDVAKLYAANDAKITFELFKWQLPYATKSHTKCQNHRLEAISDIIWNLEFPLVRTCAQMHRCGIYLDKNLSTILHARYAKMYQQQLQELQDMVQGYLDNALYIPASVKRPFTSAKDFNPNSPKHVQYLLYTVMNLKSRESQGTGKNVIAEFNLPVTNQILKVRSTQVLINTFVDKLPNSVGSDQRIHASFKQLGAATGRMSSADPNMQNIPSNATDIRHMFRATPACDQLLAMDPQDDSTYTVEVAYGLQIYTPEGLTWVKDLTVGDIVCTDIRRCKVIDIQEQSRCVRLVLATELGGVE